MPDKETALLVEDERMFVTMRIDASFADFGRDDETGVFRLGMIFFCGRSVFIGCLCGQQKAAGAKAEGKR